MGAMLACFLCSCMCKSSELRKAAEAAETKKLHAKQAFVEVDAKIM